MFARRRITKLSVSVYNWGLPQAVMGGQGRSPRPPITAKGGLNYTPKAQFSDRTPSKHMSKNIHIWILQFNCRVQLSYRFTMPVRDTKRIDKKLKKSYVYRIFDTCLHGVVLLNWAWVCIIEASHHCQGRPQFIHRKLSLEIGHQANTCRIIYTYDFFSSIVI